jgi:ribosomal protein S18 acetylase RimI-like enzyme
VTLDDVPAAGRLVAAYDLAHTGESVGAEADIAADLASSEIDLATGSWLVLDPDGALCALSAAYVDATAREVYVDAYVLPDGEHAAALARWAVGRSVEQAAAEAAAAGGDGWTVSAGCHQGDAVIAGALRGAGLRRVRTFLRYRAEHDPAAPPVEADPGPGVVVRRVRAGGEPGLLEDLRALHHVLDTAFLDHYHPQARSYEEWLTYQREASGYAPDQWWLAEVDGAPAGGLIGSDRLADDNRGFVRSLGVLREFRGRGLAKALLRAAFADDVARGRTATELGVDSESPTGATHLYTSVGMRPVFPIDYYERAL